VISTIITAIYKEKALEEFTQSHGSDTCSSLTFINLIQLPSIALRGHTIRADANSYFEQTPPWRQDRFFLPISRYRLLRQASDCPLQLISPY